MNWSNQIAVVAGALGQDARAAVVRAREMGFAGIEFDAVGLGLDLTTLSGTGVREFRHQIEGNNLRLVGLRAALGPKGIGAGADLDNILARLGQVMRSARALGAPLVCMDVGMLPDAPQPPKVAAKITPEQSGRIIIPSLEAPVEQVIAPVSAPDPRQEQAVRTALLAICERADRHGCVIALSAERSDFAALAHAIKGASCPWLKVDLDAAGLVGDQWSYDQVFDRLGTLIGHVRGRDALRGKEGRWSATAIGRGSVDWPMLLANLRAADYQGFVGVDPMLLSDRTVGAAEGRKALLAIK